MTVKDFYESIEGNYKEISDRLVTDDRIKRFLVKFLESEDMKLLKDAWQVQNSELLFMYAHRLKGIALNLSLNNFADFTSDLTELYRGGTPSDKAKAEEMYSKCVKEYTNLAEKIPQIA